MVSVFDLLESDCDVCLDDVCIRKSIDYSAKLQPTYCAVKDIKPTLKVGFLESVTSEIRKAISESFDDHCVCYSTIGSEDIRQHALRAIFKTDESEE
jgi:hypothetical protein